MVGRPSPRTASRLAARNDARQNWESRIGRRPFGACEASLSNDRDRGDFALVRSVSGALAAFVGIRWLSSYGARWTRVEISNVIADVAAVFSVDRPVAGGAHLLQRPAGETGIGRGLDGDEKRALFPGLFDSGVIVSLGSMMLPTFPWGQADETAVSRAGKKMSA
jgi:hypothetical protein